MAPIAEYLSHESAPSQALPDPNLGLQQVGQATEGLGNQVQESANKLQDSIREVNLSRAHAGAMSDLLTAQDNALREPDPGKMTAVYAAGRQAAFEKWRPILGDDVVAQRRFDNEYTVNSVAMEKWVNRTARTREVQQEYASLSDLIDTYSGQWSGMNPTAQNAARSAVETKANNLPPLEKARALRIFTQKVAVNLMASAGSSSDPVGTFKAAADQARGFGVDEETINTGALHLASGFAANGSPEGVKAMAKLLPALQPQIPGYLDQANRINAKNLQDDFDTKMQKADGGIRLSNTPPAAGWQATGSTGTFGNYLAPAAKAYASLNGTTPEVAAGILAKPYIIEAAKANRPAEVEAWAPITDKYQESIAIEARKILSNAHQATVQQGQSEFQENLMKSVRLGLIPPEAAHQVVTAGLVKSVENPENPDAFDTKQADELNRRIGDQEQEFTKRDAYHQMVLDKLANPRGGMTLGPEHNQAITNVLAGNGLVQGQRIGNGDTIFTGFTNGADKNGVPLSFEAAKQISLMGQNPVAKQMAAQMGGDNDPPLPTAMVIAHLAKLNPSMAAEIFDASSPKGQARIALMSDATADLVPGSQQYTDAIKAANTKVEGLQFPAVPDDVLGKKFGEIGTGFVNNGQKNPVDAVRKTAIAELKAQLGNAFVKGDHLFGGLGWFGGVKAPETAFSDGTADLFQKNRKAAYPTFIQVDGGDDKKATEDSNRWAASATFRASSPTVWNNTLNFTQSPGPGFNRSKQDELLGELAAVAKDGKLPADLGNPKILGTSYHPVWNPAAEVKIAGEPYTGAWELRENGTNSPIHLDGQDHPYWYVSRDRLGPAGQRVMQEADRENSPQHRAGVLNQSRLDAVHAIEEGRGDDYDQDLNKLPGR